MDDLKSRIGQLGTDIKEKANADIYDYLDNRAVPELVKFVTDAAKGNLSQVQIQAGATGAPPAAAATASAFPISPKLMIIVGVGLVAVLLLTKKGRRG